MYYDLKGDINSQTILSLFKKQILMRQRKTIQNTLTYVTDKQANLKEMLMS